MSTLHELIERQVERAPAAEAVCFGSETLSYIELNRRANQVAHYLRDLGVGPDVPVGVVMERSTEMVVALLAVLKAGGAYLPLNPRDPKERIGFVLAQAGAAAVLTCGDAAAVVKGFAVAILALDAEQTFLDSLPAENPAPLAGPRHLAYIIYTSGSTGKPKGCMIEHRAICNRLEWMRDEYAVVSGDRILQKTPYTFDVSVWEFFLPLLSGACLVVAKPGGHQDNRYLVELIQHAGVTLCHFVPSMLRFFLRETGVGHCATLRHVFVSGEALPYELMREFLQRLRVPLHNLYGPTEAAVDVTYWRCEERRDRKVPIGRPIAGLQCHVLDEQLKRVPNGAEGELYLGGIGVGRGYLNQPELTRQRFVPDMFSTDPTARLYRTGDKARVLPDGEIEFLGRVDFQVKVRGFRIELGEIEETLRSHEAIEDAAVLVLHAESEDPKLVAYLVVKGGALSAKEVREFAKSKLPEYMAPNLVMFVEALPTNGHGKLDRSALPRLGTSDDAAQPTGTTKTTKQAVAAREMTVAEVNAVAPIVDELRKYFTGMLGVPSIAEGDDLFDLGATSFTMVQAVGHIQSLHNVVMPADVFLDNPTIDALARHVASKMSKTPANVSASVSSADAVAETSDAIALPSIAFRVEAYARPANGRSFSGAVVSLRSLGRLLSVLRRRNGSDGPRYLYSSAGGLRAVQAYVWVRAGGVDGLEAGFHYYHPHEHRLYFIDDRSGLDREVDAKAGFVILLVAQMTAIQPIYRDAAPSLAVVEAGYIAQALMEHQVDADVGLYPAAPLEAENIRAGCRLEPAQQFLHGLVGGIHNVDADEGSADLLASRVGAIPRFAGFLESGVDDGEGFPSAEENERLHREARHLRQFEPGTKSTALEGWEPIPAYYRLRAAKRVYRAGPIALRHFGEFLGLFAARTVAGANERRLHASVTGAYPFQLYVYVKPNAVEGVREGLYRYAFATHRLHRVAPRLSADLKSCFTPFNRRHAQEAKFCGFLVSDPALTRSVVGEDSVYYSLLEAGYIGQLLLNRQAEFGLGICPIGGLRFDKIRADFGLRADEVLLHAFVGGEVETGDEIPWQTLAERPPGMASRKIAIVGLSGRYPDAADLPSLARNLRAAKSAFRSSWFGDANAYRTSGHGERVDGMKGVGEQRHWGGFLDGVDCFDSRLFQITPAEARTMDPQERLFLEVAWECLEHGGYTAAELNRAAARVGVFVGAMWDDYQHYDSAADREGAAAEAISSHTSSIANRVSFFFDLKGPSVAVNTSCSSAMTALHQACQSLLGGECSAAIAGGVNLMSHPYHQRVLAAAEILSPDEANRPFSSEANGWIAGEGVGAVLLKRFEDAERDGDTIHGVILGTAISHSGRTARYGSPAADWQRDSMRAALQHADVEPGTISYIEAAAPGAGIADASEAAAIRDVFGSVEDTERRVFVGSIKANVGHLESASAMSQLAKVVLQFKGREIFPTLGSEPRSPMIAWDGTGLAIPDRLMAWEVGGAVQAGPRRALINAFGATGSAGHLVIEEYVTAETRLAEEETGTLIVLSAATSAQLEEAARRMCAFLETPEAAELRLGDIGYTLRVGRVAMKERLALVVRSRQELRACLDGFLRAAIASGEVFRGTAEPGVEVRSAADTGADMREFARHWVTGAVDASRDFARGGRRRVPLPTYPFVKERHWVTGSTRLVGAPAIAAQTTLKSAAPAELLAYLRGLFASVTEIPLENISANARFDDYGITSLMIKRINEQLKADFGALSAALLFEYPTIEALAGYFVAQHATVVERMFVGAAVAAVRSPAVRALSMRCTDESPQRPDRRMAIIGVSGKYPKANDLFAFWENLRNGVDCITEVPRERWDSARFAGGHDEPSRWGGFIDGVDEFDPFFFKISPKEAEEMDPQERLFLQTVWHLFEDAGYPPSHFGRQSRGKVGVFVGVMYGEYQLYSGWKTPAKDRVVVDSLHGSIANRVSYVFDFHGPSMAIDTLCSSSLTALHLAVQSIQTGECEAAIVGGVNLSIHPNKYLLHARSAMSSSDGRCRSFGAGGDGFVPGEGVGALLLKPLEHAVRDGDQIHAVIDATSVNHDGRTHGYTVPNPNAQAEMIVDALQRAGVDPRTIGYVEAHGTGTALGDPIELAGLTKAFRSLTADTQFCALGSVKSNIGHLEAAAGVAGLTKILLQIRHGKLVPSLHSRELNPELQFAPTPFFVQQELAEWKRPAVKKAGVAGEAPRRACISSFGAGGANAHAIIEEFISAPAILPAAAGENVPALIVLSARDPERLSELVARLHAFTAGEPKCRLIDLAYTLQVGREPMEERVAFVANAWPELRQRLQTIVDGRSEAGVIYRGRVQRSAGRDALLEDEDLRQVAATWIEKQKFGRLLEGWVTGMTLDWTCLYGNERPRRVSLPGYPFARERYWVPAATDLATSVEATGQFLHPLLHGNTSDLWQRRFTSTFTGEEFFLRDHQLGGERVLPAAACLELVRAAVANAAGPATKQVHLKHVGWAQPFVVAGEPRSLHVALELDAHGAVRFEVYSDDTGANAVVSRGVATFAVTLPVPRRDLESLRSELPVSARTPAACYEAFRGFGLDHGASFQVLQEIRTERGTVLARLQLPMAAAGDLAQYELHPALLDAAFQATIAIQPTGGGAAAAAIPFALEELQVFAPLPAETWVCIRVSDTVGSKLDLDLCDGTGMVCARLIGFASRPVEPVRGSACRLYQPVLNLAPLSVGAAPAWVQRFVFTCGLPAGKLQEIAAAIPSALCAAIVVGEGDAAEQFEAAALAVFERMQAVLREMPRGNVLVQVLVSADGEAWIYRGLAGLLRTARLENPRCFGQVVEVASALDGVAIGRVLDEEGRAVRVTHVRRQAHERRVLEWDACSSPAARDVLPPWRSGGVYLISGGAGGLGLIFAAEILRGINSGVVVLAGRSSLSSEKQRRLNALAAPGKAAVYHQVDIADPGAVQGLVRDIVREHGGLHGVLHAAGVVRDGLIFTQRTDDFRRVLLPKVRGVVNLDEATRDLPLDVFAVFSSTAAVFGNVGQGDYATANAFLDAFAQHRHEEVRVGRRHGRTLSINWPLWEEGGMGIAPELAKTLLTRAGLEPLSTARGVDAFYRALATDASQVMVLAGEPRKFETVFEPTTPADLPTADSGNHESSPAGTRSDLSAEARRFIRALVATTIKSPLARVKEEEPFEAYGIDSVMVMKMTDELEAHLGSLSKTLFFEYQSVAALADYFVATHPEALRRMFVAAPTEPVSKRFPVADVQPRRSSATASKVETMPREPAALDIAIIGLAGRYPQADDLDAFWANLRGGVDCITEIPVERWNWREHYDPDRTRSGAHHSKWGGFINDVDKFDPLFFNIAPNDAAALDPQERLFLETTWAALEDAGCRPEDLRGGDGRYLPAQVGVYAGVMYSEYQLLAHEQTLAGRPTVAGGIYASIANRVSYFLDLHGPSMTVDTMCSSSLSCLHLACQDLHRGVTDLAIAGGVNVTIHPNKYLLLSEGQFISTEGHCGSFGEGGDGYIPGEGVGVAILKRLSDAVRDGDQIHGVIKGSAVNHGGKTNGFTVPNPNAQHAVVAQALDLAGITPDRVTYVEAHGTGTKLGDPIEIAGLRRIFKSRAPDAGCCWIGSVKSNIGHGEAAAGIAGLTKILLQMRHGELVPSLHSAVLNPHLGLDGTPFVVNQELRAWERQIVNGTPLPRVAGISGFGAGGSNAHLIVEEFIVPARVNHPASASANASSSAGERPLLFVLSACDETRLRAAARRLRDFILRATEVKLADVAYTLQVGRQAMEARAGFVATTREDVLTRLHELAEAVPHREIQRGRVPSDMDDKVVSSLADEVAALLRAATTRRLVSVEWSALLTCWVGGAAVDWRVLHAETTSKRISLPTYPFARDRYWLAAPATPVVPAAVAPAHANGRDRSEASPVAADWLLVNEAWEPAALADDLDWRACVQRHAGKHVVVVAVSRGEGEVLLDRIRKLETAAGLDAAISLELVGFSELASWSITRTPDVVLVMGGGAAESTAESVTRGDALKGVFQLSQKLMREAWASAVRLYLVYSGSATEPALTWQALGGFLRSAMLENERHVWTSIGCFDPAARDDVQHALLREWLADTVSGSRFTDVHYRGVERCVARLVETAREATSPPVFRQGATYLITGGFGPVGALLCRELAKAYRPRLVIVSRGALDSAKQSECRALSALGATVHYFEADVGDRAALQRTLHEAKREVGPIHGVIHLARLVEDGLILSKSWDGLARVMRAKVDGTLHLDELTAAEPLEFFMLFSSMAAFGMRGTSDYGYGAAFQNAFARHRVQRLAAGERAGATIAIGWGPWSVDRYQPEQRDSRMKAAGFGLITIEAAFAWMEHAARPADGFVGAMLVQNGEQVRGDLGLKTVAPRPADIAEGDPIAERIQRWELRKKKGEPVSLFEVTEFIRSDDLRNLSDTLVDRLHGLLIDAGSEAAVPLVPSRIVPPGSAAASDDVAETIRQCLTEIIGVRDLDINKPFQDYGLDSVSGARFAILLEKRLNLKVPPLWIIDHPTVRRLAAHITPTGASADHGLN